MPLLQFDFVDGHRRWQVRLTEDCIMNDLQRVSDHARDHHLDIRCRRLLFRCWHRGTQESDLILGRFAECHLADLDSTQLARFEALLDCTDADLFDWIIEGCAPPLQHDHDLMRLIRDFCARRQPGQ